VENSTPDAYQYADWTEKSAGMYCRTRQSSPALVAIAEQVEAASAVAGANTKLSRAPAAEMPGRTRRGGGEPEGGFPAGGGAESLGDLRPSSPASTRVCQTRRRAELPPL